MMDVDDAGAPPTLVSLNLSFAYRIECSVLVATWRAVKVCNVLQEERVARGLVFGIMLQALRTITQ